MTKILQWIGAYLGWLDSWTGSYMIALLLFALTVEIILLPLAIQRQKSSIKQAKLRPKEMAIRKKYAGRNDKVTQQKMQQEIMEFYQKEGYNQFGGCLTTLIQFPILIALYNIVINPLKYVLCMSDATVNTISLYLKPMLEEKGIKNIGNMTIRLISIIKEQGMAGFEAMKTFAVEGSTDAGLNAYNELAGMFDRLPDFTIFGGKVNLGLNPGFTDLANTWPLLLVPVLTFLAYFFSMKLTRKLVYQPAMAGAEAQAMGCSNNIMDIAMPAFSVYITFITPAAVGVYWIFKSLISSLEQFILYKAMPLPKFTEEDYKAAEKEINGKAAKAAARAPRDPNAPRPRSLHHIDDEDYDANGNRIVPVEAKPEALAEKTPVEAAPLKNDEDRPAKEEKTNTAESKAEEKADAETDGKTDAEKASDPDTDDANEINP